MPRSNETQDDEQVGETTVLVVGPQAEDTGAVGTRLAETLDDAEVLTAAGADAGRDRIADERIDCVVVEHRPPALDAIAFLDGVRRNQSHVQVVVTSDRGREFVSDALAAGASDVVRTDAGLAEPVQVADRLRVVLQWEGMPSAGDKTDRSGAASTGSQEHEDALAALHRTARDLVACSSRTEVAETTVAAVHDILDMPSNAVHLHNEDTNTLPPVAWTPEGKTLVGSIPTFAPGEGLAWEVFETGEPQVHADVSAVPGRLEQDTPVRSEVILPLGDHGVLLAGSAEPNAFDDRDVSLAQTLVAHATTVLDRIDQEQALHSARSFVDQALDALEDIFYVVGPDGEMRRWNDRLVDVTGYDEAVIATMDACEFFPEDDRDTIRKGLAGTLSDGQSTVEADVVTADGERIPHEFTGTRLTNPDGEVTGIVGIGRDVSVRQEREQELRREQERFSNLFESVPEPVVHVQLRDGEPVVLNVNAAFESVFGLDAATIVGESLDDYLVPDAHEEEATDINRRASSGEAVTREVRRETVDGERTFLFRVVQTETDWDRTEAVGMYVDISDRKRRERQLERQNERLDQFAKVVSHDLQNPLNVATGYLAELRRDLDRDELDAIADALDRMEALIDDLLRLARSGEQTENLEAVALQDVARGCWENVATADAMLVVEIDREIHAEPGRLKQLLENVFSNAVDHGGDDVTITVGALETGFYVADDGPGIPPDTQDAVFENGYTTSTEGTGVGLSIVDEVARAHDWTVTLTESGEGGARFEFTGVDGPE